MFSLNHNIDGGALFVLSPCYIIYVYIFVPCRLKVLSFLNKELCLSMSISGSCLCPKDGPFV